MRIYSLVGRSHFYLHTLFDNRSVKKKRLFELLRIFTPQYSEIYVDVCSVIFMKQLWRLLHHQRYDAHRWNIRKKVDRVQNSAQPLVMDTLYMRYGLGKQFENLRDGDGAFMAIVRNTNMEAIIRLNLVCAMDEKSADRNHLVVSDKGQNISSNR